MDYDDPDVEELWCNERRGDVVAYLQQQRVPHGQVGEWPAWHVAPYVSVWAIESVANPGWVGWWVIAGDLPTDYISADTIKHPREAIRSVASRWQEAATHMEQGQSVQGFSIGEASDARSLAPLLSSRAQLLQRWVADPTLWSEL
jgi:hypothetical protein